jgi:hypothetical protein
MLFPGYYKIVLKRVGRAERRNDSSRAERILSSAVNWRPLDCELRFVEASFYVRQGRLANAERIIREVTGKCQDDYQLQCLLAEVVHRQGRPDEAGQIASALVSDAPGEGEAWFVLAALAADSGNYDEALLLVKKAAEGRLSPQTRANAVSIATDAGDAALAEGLARQAVREAPKDPALHILLAVVLEGRDASEATKQWRLAKRYRRRISEDTYRRKVRQDRAMLANFGARPLGPLAEDPPGRDKVQRTAQPTGEGPHNRVGEYHAD